MYFSCKCFCFKQKTIIFATRPEYLYHTKRRKTGDRRADAPSPPIMDRETILPEMTDMEEPALAYTAVGESRSVAHPDARKTLSELGKEEEEAMQITDHTINLTNLNKKKQT